MKLAILNSKVIQNELMIILCVKIKKKYRIFSFI